MAKKTGLPIERHREIGSRLVAIREELMALYVEIANSHPKSSRAVRAAMKAQNSVDSLRCTLDSIACSLPGGSLSTYYPSRGVESAAAYAEFLNENMNGTSDYEDCEPFTTEEVLSLERRGRDTNKAVE